jgi:hypothetical protein
MQHEPRFGYTSDIERSVKPDVAGFALWGRPAWEYGQRFLSVSKCLQRMHGTTNSAPG